MVGIIHRREQIKIPEPSFNPDDMFDANHVATEANFINLLDHGVYDSKYIGYKVQLSNSVDYNDGIWVIADVNHDSENTGQTNCYDLISEDCFYSGSFGSSQSWRSSTPRTWLNNTFYPGFSTEFKNHVLNPKYNSQGTWYTDDKIILPSKVEVNGGTSGSSTDSEGIVYPIFTGTTSVGSNSSRIKSNYWLTRSRYVGASRYVWYVHNDGAIKSGNTGNTYYLAPLMRVS